MFSPMSALDKLYFKSKLGEMIFVYIELFEFNFNLAIFSLFF